MKWMMVFVSMCWSVVLTAQDVSVLLKEADNLERQLKEPEALDKYKQLLVIDPTNVRGLVKAAELNVQIGGRQTEKSARKIYFESAYSFAQRAYAADPKNPDANFVMSMASGKMTDVETDNKKIVGFVKDVRTYAQQALNIQASHAKANYSLGKWHYEMVNLSGFKKVAVKLFYGGMPDASLDSAIAYFEKSRTNDPYFISAYLDLAKSYRDNHQPTQAIEVLNKLVKLPFRTVNDIALKAEGAKLLESVQ